MLYDFLPEAPGIPQVAILVETTSGWGRRIISGILDYAGERGSWHIWVRPQHRGEMPLLRPEINGIIARVSCLKDARKLRKTGLPVVNISGIPLAQLPFPQVVPDNEEAGRIAFDHFASRGIKHFGYVGPVENAVVKSHFEGFRRAIKECGREVSLFGRSSEFESFADWKSWSIEIRDWLESLPKPVGIFTWNAETGREVVEACRFGRVPVPSEVAVLGGNHDGLLDTACYPPLSGVDVPSEQIGRQAAMLLDRMMQGDESVPRVVTIKPVGVVARRSTETLAVDDPQLIQVVEFIQQNVFKPITVQDVLRSVPMARRSLERKFKDAFGKTPAEDIRQRRIAKAKALLTDTDMQMQAIAEACGYANYNYLTYVFKMATGLSPSQYRFRTTGKGV